jgi:hypothetical protein
MHERKPGSQAAVDDNITSALDVTWTFVDWFNDDSGQDLPESSWDFWERTGILFVPDSTGHVDFGAGLPVGETLLSATVPYLARLALASRSPYFWTRVRNLDLHDPHTVIRVTVSGRTARLRAQAWSSLPEVRSSPLDVGKARLLAAGHSPLTRASFSRPIGDSWMATTPMRSSISRRDSRLPRTLMCDRLCLPWRDATTTGTSASRRHWPHELRLPVPKQSTDEQVLAVDEARMCLGPPTPAAGLRVYLNPDEIQGKGISSVCHVDASGTLFLASVGSTEWFEGSGWTHSAFWGTPSTLSADAETRCSHAPAPSFVQTCP